MAKKKTKKNKKTGEYTIVHTSPVAVKSHLKKIKKRGGSTEITKEKGKTKINYSF